MKKILSGFLALILILCVCSGCSMTGDVSSMPGLGNTDEVNEETIAGIADTASDVFGAQPAEPSYPLTTEDVTISISYPHYSDWAMTGIEQLIAALEETTGVTIALDAIAVDSYAEELNLRNSNGDVSDLIFAAPDGWTNSDWMSVLQPMDELLAEYGYYYLHAANAYSGGVQSLVEDDGTIMRLYTFFEEEQFVPTIGVMIREDWLTELGFDMPETYDDYHDLLLAMKTEYDAKLPFRLPVDGVAPGDCFTAGFGISLGADTVNSGFYQEDGVVKYGGLEEGFTEYVTMMHSWYEEGIITDYYLDLVDLYSNSYLMELSVNQKSGVFFVPLTSYASLEAMCEFPIVAGMDPVKTSGEQTHLASDYPTSISLTGFSLSASCENPELAIQVADWFYSDEAVLIANYGTEGETYTLEDGQPVFTDLIVNNPDGLTPEEALQKYTTYNLQGVEASACLPYLQSEILEPLEAWKQQKDTSSMLPSGLRMTDDEEAEYSLLIANISTYLASATAQLVSGDMALSEIPQVQERLHELDIDRALEIWQTALDRYS